MIMTHYYYYIAAGTTWDGTTAIYKIAVSDSMQGRRDFLYITAYSVDHQHYFEIVSAKSDNFIRRTLQSLAIYGISIVHVSARDLVRSLRANEALTLSQEALHNAHTQRMALNLGYRVQSKINARRA